jgi:murein DD-endopeptidase MepM/ murein hydrolase activator NlpD
MTGAPKFQHWLAKAPARQEIIAGVRGFAPTATGANLAEAPKQPAYGGYGEDRSVYTQELFAPAGEEPRTVHLGLDIFSPAGTDIITPLHARLHSFQVNDKPGDYGPTIFLEHAPAPGLVFHTLYGHLSRDSLKGRKRGDAFMAGERIGKLGVKSENGGWPPHLHFQVILDIGSAKGDFPGVCRKSEQEKWLAICPDPRPLLGLA